MFATLRTFSRLVGFNTHGPEAADTTASPLEQCDPEKVRTVLGKSICADGHQEGLWDSGSYVVTESFESSIGKTFRTEFVVVAHDMN